MIYQRNVNLLIVVIFIITSFASCKKKEEFANDKYQNLQLLNQLRKSGCQCGNTYMPPVYELKWNEALYTAADFHARDMYSNNYLSHISLGGTVPAQRAANAGYTGTVVGENIAKGYTTVLSVIYAWKNSESHCIAMMDSTYTEAGIAEHETYWVMDLGK